MGHRRGTRRRAGAVVAAALVGLVLAGVHRWRRRRRPQTSAGGVAGPRRRPRLLRHPASSRDPWPHETLWLCKPGLPDNPCEGGLDATVIATGRQRAGAAVHARGRPGRRLLLRLSDRLGGRPGISAPAEGDRCGGARGPRPGGAILADLPGVRPDVPADHPQGPGQRRAHRSRRPRARAYSDVLSAFNDYLNTENDGRPIVLIGHSQGSWHLTQLIQQRDRRDPALRQRLLSALLLGGTLHDRARPSPRTARFLNVPTCQSQEQSGCVVGYSTYDGTPPREWHLRTLDQTPTGDVRQPGGAAGPRRADRLRADGRDHGRRAARDRRIRTTGFVTRSRPHRRRVPDHARASPGSTSIDRRLRARRGCPSWRRTGTRPGACTRPTCPWRSVISWTWSPPSPRPGSAGRSVRVAGAAPAAPAGRGASGPISISVGPIRPRLDRSARSIGGPIRGPQPLACRPWPRTSSASR